MTGWTEILMSHMTPWPIGVLFTASAVSLLFGVIGTVMLLRVRRTLQAVPRLQERLDTLTNSVALLTDTTEACFRALSTQVEFMRAAAVASGHIPAPPVKARAQAPLPVTVPSPEPISETQAEVTARKARQRRVVGAARRGEALAAIAAREDLAETEVALRLHVNQQHQQAAEPARYGSLLS